MKTYIIALPVLVAALALGGCASTQQTIQDNPNTAAGVGIGAVGGALIGSAVGGSGHRTQAAVIGAVVGGLAGGMIGNRMDEQERALRQQMANTGVDVQRQGDNIVLVFPDQISFAVGSSQIKSQFMGTLDNVAQSLQQYPDTHIQIAGFTDSTGTPSVNQRLSEDRAFSVRDYLSNRGIAVQRMQAVGYGQSRPIASNSTADGRAQNRRVEITVIPNQR
jgi:outer membrane protein OmpA-like peptidoglycan-associated protein